MPGIAVEPLPGHTPGHVGFRLHSKGEELLVWGDACGIASVQFAEPGAGLVFDVDGEQAVRTRRRLLAAAADDQTLVASTHLPFPTFGRVERFGTAYRWQPDEYRYGL